jgi:hypothetical protein
MTSVGVCSGGMSLCGVCTRISPLGRHVRQDQPFEFRPRPRMLQLPSDIDSQAPDSPEDLKTELGYLDRMSSK